MKRKRVRFPNLHTKIIILFFYIQRQPTFIYYHKSLSFKSTNTICRQAEDISIRFLLIISQIHTLIYNFAILIE